jgi:hypothetical protein
MGEKIFCGNGKEKFDGDMISVTLNVDELAKSFNDYGFTTDAGKRMIKVNVCKGRNVDQYGNTHYVTIDTWKPTPKGDNVATATVTQQGNVSTVKAVFVDDIPDDSGIPF